MTTATCVVCSQLADVYCRQDSAALCHACDQQVHSANPLASRHTRVPISNVSVPDAMPPNYVSDVRINSARTSEPESDLRSSPAAGSVDDDAFFAVPDVDTAQPAQDDTSPFISKNFFGKGFLSDDLDLGEIDPAWLDRLDCGVGSMPSDFLDSLVPEEPPVKRQSSTLVRTSSAQAANVVPEHPSPPEATPARKATPIHIGHPAHVPQHPAQQQQAVHFMPADAHYYAPQAPHMVPFQPHTQPTPPPQPLLKPQPGEIQIDIDNYVPCSLRPLDPQTRAALLHARHAKLQRFRDKKRNRHFKKTIRYASRKAYAEVRPRIKGRFARKDEVAAMRAAGTLPAVE